MSKAGFESHRCCPEACLTRVYAHVCVSMSPTQGLLYALLHTNTHGLTCEAVVRPRSQLTGTAGVLVGHKLVLFAGRAGPAAAHLAFTDHLGGTEWTVSASSFTFTSLMLSLNASTPTPFRVSISTLSVVDQIWPQPLSVEVWWRLTASCWMNE